MAILSEEFASKHNLTADEALIVSKHASYIRFHMDHKKNRIDGRTWNRTTKETFANSVGFGLTPRILQRIYKSLIKKNVLIKSNYNAHKYDRTCWYAFTNEDEVMTSHGLKKYAEPRIEPSKTESSNGKIQMVHSKNPNGPTYTNPIKTPNKESSSKEQETENQDTTLFTFTEEQKETAKAKNLDITEQYRKNWGWCSDNQKAFNSSNFTRWLERAHVEPVKPNASDMIEKAKKVLLERKSQSSKPKTAQSAMSLMNLKRMMGNV